MRDDCSQEPVAKDHWQYHVNGKRLDFIGWFLFIVIVEDCKLSCSMENNHYSKLQTYLAHHQAVLCVRIVLEVAVTSFDEIFEHKRSRNRNNQAKRSHPKRNGIHVNHCPIELIRVGRIPKSSIAIEVL